MPSGVSKDFLDLTKQGQLRAWRALAVAFALALLGAFVAEMLDPERVGGYVLLYLAALAGGLATGGLLGWLETRSWGQALKGSWQAWMQAAQGAGTMGEAAHRAGALDLSFGRFAASLLVLLNGSVLVASWFELPPFELTSPYGALAVITVAATGLAIGASLVLRLVEAWWCRSVEQQTLHLVQEGRIGVWGVR